MRRLTVCLLGPTALILTAIAIALTPTVSNAAEVNAANIDAAFTNTSLAAVDNTWQVSDSTIGSGAEEAFRASDSDEFGTYSSGKQLDPNTVTFSAPSDGIAAREAAFSTLERNAVIVVAVSAVALGVGIVFLVTRWRGKKQPPRKDE